MIRLANMMVCEGWPVCQAVQARGPAHVDERRMMCGGHSFEPVTTWTRGAPARLAWNAQSPTAEGGKQVGLDEPADSDTQALPAAVTGWQCVAGTKGDVLVLASSCASDDLAPCGGQHDWFRLVSPMGNRLDAGYKPQDDRIDGMLDRLGLSGRMSQGLSLRDVIK